MFADSVFPETLTASQLDVLLEAGWFRMGHGAFTTHFLQFNHTLYSAIWLRIELEGFQLSASQQRLFKQNARFDVAIGPLHILPQHEELFNKYREEAISFTTSESLQKLLFNTQTHSPFNTHQIVVSDKGQVIAVGYFDLGATTVQGIVCYYHPDYKKFSLGRYLMLLKLEFAQKHQFSYFYPGYFSPNYPAFDYKLTLAPAQTEFYDVLSRSWKPLSDIEATHFPLPIIKQRLEELKGALLVKNIPFEEQIYDFFDVNMTNHFNKQGLLEHPMFLYLMLINENELGIAVYNPFSELYELMLCHKAYNLLQPSTFEGHFTDHLLRPFVFLVKEASVTDFVNRLSYILEKNPLSI